MTTLKRTAMLLLCASALTGCADEPARPKLGASVPKTWTSGNGVDGTYTVHGWVEDFRDQALVDLVNEALENNNDLQATAANMDLAAAQAKKAGADLFPLVNLNGSAGRSGNFESSDARGQYGVSLDVSWELDVWGRIRAGEKAAAYDYYAAEHDYEAARQSLSAQTAKAYFLAIETGKQLELAESYQYNLEKTLDVTQAFFDEGLVSKQDIHLTKAELARAKEALKNAQSARLSALRSLELLLGHYPAAALNTRMDFPYMPAPVAAGLPSEILERRPDIRAAERRVAAAFNRVKMAKAAKLPAISLTGSVGANSPQLFDLTDPENMLWNAVGNILFPIFNAGELDADIDIRTAEQKAAIANYQQTALQSFSDVETALSNESLFRARQKNLDEAYENAHIAEVIAGERYQAGEIEMLDLLQIKRSAITAQINRISGQRELLDQRVNLHLALGGRLQSDAPLFPVTVP